MDLAYSEYGQGQPVVILHGLFGSRRNWQSIARRLAADFKVIVPDLPNHGDSGWTDDMSYPAMAAAIFEFAERHGIGRPVMIGHSMGGKVAMAMAHLRPDAIAALAVIDIAPVEYRHDFHTFIQAMADLDLTGLSSRGDADARLRIAVPDDATRAFLLQNLATQEGKYAWRINLQAIRANMENIAGFPNIDPVAYRGPALFLGGGRSDYLLPENEQEIRVRFPTAIVERIDGADHWVHVSRPDAFLDRIFKFLKMFK